MKLLLLRDAPAVPEDGSRYKEPSPSACCCASHGRDVVYPVRVLR